MTATGSLRYEGCSWTKGLGTIIANHSDPGSGIFPSSASILSLIHLANTDAADSVPHESVRVCRWQIIPTDISQR